MPTMASAHYGVLERIARGRPLPEILNRIVRMVEGEFLDSYCSIVLYDAASNSLRHGAANRLPHDYAMMIDGLPAGPTVGSCGAAAFLGQQVIVEDIATHPNWEGAREHALRHGLRASWSTPIKAADGKVLGTFAIYRSRPGLPGERELKAVDLATHTAAIAISRARQDEEKLQLVDALERRVQQMTAVHRVSRLLEDHGELDSHLLGRIAATLPPALPSARVIRLRLGALSASSAPFDPALLIHSEPFGEGTSTGSIDLGAAPESREELKLRCPEERELLHSIAQMLSRQISRTQAEQRLEQQRGLLAVACRSAKMGGVLINLETWEYVLSDEACALLELEPGEVLHREQVVRLVQPDHLERLRGAFWSAMTTDRSCDVEFELTTRRGRTFWARLVAEAVKDDSGKAVQVRGAIQDVGDRRRLEDQFRQAQKMEAVGRLAGGVAHDFNNLLSVILGYSQVASDRLPEGDPVRSDMQQIDIAVERASELTGQLLSFSRQTLLKPRVIELSEVVSSMKQMLHRLLGADVELVFLYQEGLGSVFADRGQLEQVIMNLVLNARDAMPGGGTIRVELEDVDLDRDYASQHVGVVAGPYVRLSVSDTGTGMNAEVQRRIFEPFFTTKEHGKGTGLGLSTVWGIVSQSGGHVSVRSEAGKGSTFLVHLPRSDRPIDEGEEEPQVSVRAGGSETVLLVEDDHQLRELMASTLGAQGYSVLTAQNGLEALRQAAEFEGPIHLLLTDVVMPKMGGFELARLLSEMRPDSQVLFVSGYTEESISHHGMRPELTHFVAKPVAPQALLRRLREVLDGGAEENAQRALAK